MKHINRGLKKIKQQAEELVRDPRFLFLAGEKVGELGVAGEERNRLILILAGIGRTLPEPPSVIIKGSTSSGKSTLLKDCVQLFPPESVIERAGLSGKALAYRKESLADKILLINEYRCGKDAQLLLRLIQSDGGIKHEATTVQGSARTTTTVERNGTPVVLTTTTQDRVFEDDETRFLSLSIDESQKQTLAILMAQATVRSKVDYQDLRVWRTAMSLVAWKEGDFEHPPVWLGYVAGKLPLSRVRVRRDWSRFLAFCKAIALCRGGLERDKPLDITFQDYCVAFEIFEPVLAATLRGLPTQQLMVAQAVAALTKTLQRAVTTREVAERLEWKESLVYKHVNAALINRLLKYEPGVGAREKNVKRLLCAEGSNPRFLPSPKSVFKNNSMLGSEISYVDPLTGETKVLRRN